MLRHREECLVELETEMGVVQPPASSHPRWSGANRSWKRQGRVLPRVPGGAWALLITWCELLTFRTIREKVSVLLSHPVASVWSSVTAATGNQYTTICYLRIHFHFSLRLEYTSFSWQEADFYSSLGFLQYSALTWRHLFLFCICCNKKLMYCWSLAFIWNHFEKMGNL